MCIRDRFTGLAAIAYAAVTPTVQPGTGAGLEMDAIGGVFVGGVAEMCIRDSICNIGIVQKDGVMLINSGYQATNPDLDLSTQEWYTNAVDNYNPVSYTHLIIRAVAA